MLVFSEKNIDLRGLPAEVQVVPLNAATRPEIEVAVCGRATARKLAAQDLPRLKLVQLVSAGYDGVPLDEFARKGIPVANAGGVYSVPIAETVVFGMLLMAKKYRRNPNNRRVRYARGYAHIGELAGKTVLILGAGSIGTEIARRLAGFQMRILGFDLLGGTRDGFERVWNALPELYAALKAADYVVSTLPANAGTQGLVDGEFLRRMRPGAVFVNVGRRAVVDEHQLYRALKSRTLGGAVLDMFEWFPNPLNNRFRRLDNVIVLPGVAAISREGGFRLQQLIAGNIVRILNQEPPGHVVNRPERHE